MEFIEITDMKKVKHYVNTAHITAILEGGLNYDKGAQVNLVTGYCIVTAETAQSISARIYEVTHKTNNFA
jgi:hypothetical protein